MFQLPLVYPDQANIAGMNNVQFNILTNQSPDQVGKFGQHICQIQDFGLQRLASGKGQKLANLENGLRGRKN